MDGIDYRTWRQAVQDALLSPNDRPSDRESRVASLILEYSLRCDPPREWAYFPKLEHFATLLDRMTKGSVCDTLRSLQLQEIITIRDKDWYRVNPPPWALRAPAPAKESTAALREWLKLPPEELKLRIEPPNSLAEALSLVAANRATNIINLPTDTGNDHPGGLPSRGAEAQADYTGSAWRAETLGGVRPAERSTAGAEEALPAAVSQTEAPHTAISSEGRQSPVPNFGTAPHKAVGTANQVVPKIGTQPSFQKLERVPKIGTEGPTGAGIPKIGTQETPENIDPNEARSKNWNAAVPKIGTSLNSVNTSRIDRSHSCVQNTLSSTNTLKGKGRQFTRAEQELWNRMVEACEGQLFRNGADRGFWIACVRTHPELIEGILEELESARKVRSITMPAAWMRGTWKKVMRAKA